MRWQVLLRSLVLALLAVGAQGFIPLATSPWGCRRGAGGLGDRSGRRGGLCTPVSLGAARMVGQPAGMQTERAPLGRREALRAAFAAAVLGGGASGVMADGEQGGAQKPPGEAGKKTKGFGRTLVDGMLAGAVAGAAVDLALYPLDTVKTRLQTKTGAPSFQELYSGLSASLAGHVPSSALFFAVYQTSKVYVLEGVFGGGSAASQLIASGLGNIAASTIRVPTEVVKTRMQSGNAAEVGECVRDIVKADGVKGLFRGYPAFLLRDLPFDAIEFLAYEQLRLIYLATLASGGQIGDVETAVIGALAGGITGALTCPLDTIRARTMNEAGLSDRLYDGPFETAKAIVEEEGVAALFSGVVPRVVWLSLGGTVFFSSLEAARSFFAAL